MDHIYLLHLGNILYLIAYLVRDILWLRILTVAGTISLMGYYFCCSLQPPIIWSTLFTLVNIVQITLLIRERRPVFLGEEEQRLYRTVFRTLAPREFVKLMALAQWKRAPEDQVVLEQGSAVDNLILLTNGRGAVELDGRHIADIGPGEFVGEMGFLTGQPASANVVTRLPVEYLSWDVDSLRAYFDESPQLHAKMQGILGVDLVGKLRREGFAAAHPSKIADFYQQGEQ